MLVISFEYDSSLNSLDERLKIAIAEKLVSLTMLMQEKVINNLSGKILQQKTGQLAGSIQQSTETSGNPMIGIVYPEPASPKAWVLEKGGDRAYTIIPTKAGVLRFYWDKIGAIAYFRSVNHPPSREFGYLRHALEEMEQLVPEGFREAIQTVLDGR